MHGGTYRGGVGHARPGTGDPHGVPKPTQPVDQASVYGVAARPHPAPGDGVDLGDSPAAALRDLRHEVVVDRVQGHGQPPAFLFVEAPAGGEHQGVLAAGDGSRGEAEPLKQRPHDHLATEHADRPGEGGGQGEDHVGRAGDVVAAGRRQRAHRDDHRLGLAQQGDLAPDRLRGHRGTPG